MLGEYWPPFVLIAIAIVAAFVLLLLERIWPADRLNLSFDRPHLSTDLGYWLVTPFFTRWLSRAAALAVLALGLWAFGSTLSLRDLNHGWGPARDLPLWCQAIGIILIGDLTFYWVHRLLHARLWSIHAIHHSMNPVDTIGYARVHPLDDVITHVAMAVFPIALGFGPIAVAPIIPIFGLHVWLCHANVRWAYGFLGRWLIVSPAFHRWHHTSEPEHLDKNFAGLFVFWDRLFGTYHFPQDSPPKEVGVHDAMPTSLLGQLRYPFTRGRRDEESG